MLKGREWCLSDEAGFTSEYVKVERVIEALDELFRYLGTKRKI